MPPDLTIFYSAILRKPRQNCRTGKHQKGGDLNNGISYEKKKIISGEKINLSGSRPGCTETYQAIFHTTKLRFFP
jgi:hypothetical protein